jgi:hypothetical protein
VSESVAATADRIAEYLQDLGVSRAAPDAFVAKRGSAVVRIRILPWATDDASRDECLVEVTANVVDGARLGVEILRQLLEFNASAAYGAFGVTEAGKITYHHCLLGSSLAQAELIEVIHEVATVADDWDDVIVEQAGGKTAVDKLEELKRPKAQPTIEPAPAADGDAAGEEG